MFTTPRSISYLPGSPVQETRSSRFMPWFEHTESHQECTSRQSSKTPLPPYVLPTRTRPSPLVCTFSTVRFCVLSLGAGPAYPEAMKSSSSILALSLVKILRISSPLEACFATISMTCCSTRSTSVASLRTSTMGSASGSAGSRPQMAGSAAGRLRPRPGARAGSRSRSV